MPTATSEYSSTTPRPLHRRSLPQRRRGPDRLLGPGHAVEVWLKRGEEVSPGQTLLDFLRQQTFILAIKHKADDIERVERQQPFPSYGGKPIPWLNNYT